MATEEYLIKLIEAGTRYESLPPRFKLTVNEDEWRRK